MAALVVLPIPVALAFRIMGRADDGTRSFSAKRERPFAR